MKELYQRTWEVETGIPEKLLVTKKVKEAFIKTQEMPNKGMKCNFLKNGGSAFDVILLWFSVNEFLLEEEDNARAFLLKPVTK